MATKTSRQAVSAFEASFSSIEIAFSWARPEAVALKASAAVHMTTEDPLAGIDLPPA
jgi:hypothetical protein